VARPVLPIVRTKRARVSSVQAGSSAVISSKVFFELFDVFALDGGSVETVSAIF